MVQISLLIINITFIVLLYFFIKKNISIIKEEFSFSVKEELKKIKNELNIKYIDEINFLEEKIKDQEIEKRISANRISVLEYNKKRIDDLYKSINKIINHLNIKNNKTLENIVDDLSENKKVILYSHYCKTNLFLNKKVMAYDDFISRDRVCVTDNGEDWKKHKFAQRYTKNYTGIYDWYFKFKNELL